ncbi:MAG: hypothetical protein E7Z77_02410 [Methanobrevibacter sp.]|uniref:hypothetical protein n=1 Tax=Methanobrevibacter sp. TaxID=66852 RepID=UPI0025D4AD8C|nr:hypothetical protein [Methanobrevibacter sp.]MBE6508247.1 hypothetical protein [Methanobrevibacter sp.]
MTKTQTVQELLNQFYLRLDLPLAVLNLEVEGSFDSFRIVKQMLPYINSKGNRSYALFDCYHFENDQYYCTIVPDNARRMVIMAEKFDDFWHCDCFDKFGELSARS